MERHLVATELTVEAVWSLVVGAVLVLTSIVIVIHLLSILASLMFGLFPVPSIGTFGLGELVNFSTGEASEKFFGECMVDFLAWLMHQSKNTCDEVMDGVPSLR